MVETRRFRALARHKAAACVAVALLPMVFRLALLPWRGIPEPWVHDEFSYLLGADTFAKGRLTNPPHPLWEFFETPQVNQHPTYQTKYPPAQPLMLAIGQVVLGHPWWGVWLSFGIMSGVMCWMLQGWLPPPYAMMAALVAVVEVGPMGLWMNSYWGGCVPAIGGALITGALPRLARRADGATSLAAGIGLAILVHSRPFEGAVAGATVLGLLIWMRRKRGLRELLSLKVLAGVSAPVVLALVAMAVYNKAGTGDALTPPYLVHEREYAATPRFWFLPPHPAPSYRLKQLRDLWVGWDGTSYWDTRRRPTRRLAEVLIQNVYPLFGVPAAVVTLLGLIFYRGDKAWAALTICAAGLLALGAQRLSMAHYLAPTCSGMYVLMGRGIRVLYQRLGLRRLCAGVRLALLFGGIIAVTVFRLAGPPWKNPFQRGAVVREFDSKPGRHLVIVRYGPDHNFTFEYVYNRADIDASTIVWAQDLGVERNRAILEYYPDRTVWLLQPDSIPYRLERYPK